MAVTMIFNIPENLAREAELNEDTVFTAHIEDGKLVVIVLCLDNDVVGYAASVWIKELLNNIGYIDVRIHHPHSKD